MALIALIDDDPEMRSMVEDHLRASGYEVRAFGRPTEALAALLAGDAVPSVVLTDLQMPEMSGIDLTKRLKAKFPDLPVILMTAFGSIESAVDAMRKGAFDYLTKPFKLVELNLVVERAALMAQLTRDNEVLRTELRRNFSKGQLIGKSKAMTEIFDLLERVAPAQSNVLITGESGTGKEVIARTLHQMSPRSARPFVAVNCTAIPETLLESELFGHAKGAFTGADRRKPGLFEEAQGGTLFLDEIGDMPPALQAKLLRVLQERRIRPLGETKDLDIDVRVIAATHKNLKKGIQEGIFREDLYYRLNVIPLPVPPLRHRKEDIPLLAQAFVEKYAALNKSNTRGFTPVALHLLMEQSWPGNVRELENLVERMVVMSRKTLLDESDIPAPESAAVEDFYGHMTQDLPSLEDLERRYMQFVLLKTGGKKDRASQILGINRRTLYRKEREYGFVTGADEDPDDPT
ncbi:MAG: sigma-54-dependent Fis family transcriptional regulator [Bdellovibrionaceae bacterium]|nr:sigma-54-dependent Fis family transcriptional regulator [Pseudobdellovibrionaceae bacterium]MBX3034027.1 sigma-54-dependent Fis family transcriptional regulator [Pseudobdellovibrionaceae bacterium]